jgi:8-oxo-dGTP pyrophosphatase MutT (NUDIX family)
MAVDSLERLDTERIDRSMEFRPADALVMSCGTVTLDLARGLVLLIWNQRLRIHQLPKGRRNIEEPMLTAALRETYEETGIRVTPLRLNIATRATPPKPPSNGRGQKNPDITVGCPSTEFVGACLYPDPQSETEALKTVFYYAATADSTIKPDAGTQEAWEELGPRWVAIADVASILCFQGEIAAVQKAVDDVKKTGYTIGA